VLVHGRQSGLDCDQEGEIHKAEKRNGDQRAQIAIFQQSVN
jgi:hypothetical protein